MLFDRPENGGIARVGEQAKRMPEPEGGLQRARVGQQLTVVDVAVDQDRPELGGAGQQVRPPRATSRPAQQVRGLSGRTLAERVI